MDVVNTFGFLLLCLVTGNITNAQSHGSEQLLKRIERLKHHQRKTQSKIHHLERRVHSQSMVIEAQAHQISSLQKEVQTDRKLTERTNHELGSNTNKLNVLMKNLTSGTSDNKQNGKNRHYDTNSVQVVMESSQASIKRLTAGSRQKQNARTKSKIVLPDGSSLEKRQEMPGISFSVYLYHDVDVGNHQTIKFNKVIINDGNGYNVHTGVFTCPKSVVYMLSFFIGQRSETTEVSEVYIELVINSENIVDAVVETVRRSQDLQGGNTVIKRLKQGDVVWVASASTAGHVEGSLGNRLSTFSGVYLYL